MKLGMNLLLWTGAASDEHLPLIRDIKTWGYDGVEFPMFAADGSPWGIFAKELDALGLGRTAVTVMPPGTNLISDDAAERAAGLEHLKRCVDSCVVLGATALCGPIYSPVGRLVGRGPNDAERARCIEGLKALGAHAKGSGVAISYEPLNRFETYFVNCQADAAAISAAIGMDNVGHMYDTFHANIEEKGLAEAVATGGKWINHVHVSSNDRSTPGEDHIDYATTFAALKKIGYDGWLTIEAFGMWIPDLAGATCIWRKMAPSEEHIARQGGKFTRALWEKS